MQYVVLGWAQSVGTVTVGVPCSWPTSCRKLGGPMMGKGHSHSEPQSVRPARGCVFSETRQQGKTRAKKTPAR